MSENIYLYKYLMENDKYDKEIIYYLQTTLNSKIYYFGGNHKNHFEKKNRKLNFFKKVITFTGIFLLSKITNRKISGKRKIVSSAYFNLHTNLEYMGFEVIKPMWTSFDFKRWDFNWRFFYSYIKLLAIIELTGLDKLLRKKTFFLIKEFKQQVKEWLVKEDIRALIVPSDLNFFFRLTISACSELNIPTFLASHGLPGRYNNVDDNSTNYLLVWGEKIKANYVKAGIPMQKIIVTGHPKYSNFKIDYIKFSLDDILVITKGVNGVPAESNKTILSDRGNLILYLYSIQKVLEKIGVKKVRLRNHPSESSKWYLQHIDNKFFEIDTKSLDLSLETSSLVIGPTSTVFLEAILKGVNYIVYEPSNKGFDLFNYPIVNPFDGTDNRIPIAFNEEELMQILEKQVKVVPEFIHDYIKFDFDISFFNELI